MDETETHKIEHFAGHLKEYVQVRIDETRLMLAERTAKVLSQLIADGIILAVFGICLLFGATAGAFALGVWLHSTALGFVLVAGFFFLAAIVMRWSKQRMIRKPVMDEIIYQLFQNGEDDEED